MSIIEFEKRKRDHLELALDNQHQATGLTGLESIHLQHDSLPELNANEISLNSVFLNRELKTPFVITGMTAGHADANVLNQRFAEACARRGWIFGLGSQRREIDFSTSTSVDQISDIREKYSNLFLASNLGISQFLETPRNKIEDLVHRTGAQVLVVHLNPLQEVLQPEGTPTFKGALAALQKFSEESKTPLILKETGCGFSELTLRKIQNLKLAAVDVSGLGGTHWGRIEGARALASSNTTQAQAAQVFENWGESTVDSVIAARKILKITSSVWASGGVRTGLDAAKLIALGADHVGFAKPALEAALKGTDALNAWMEQIEFQLKAALFCTGSKTPKELQQKDGIWTRKKLF